MAKRFFYVSMGILTLALSFHLGTLQVVQAQGMGTISVGGAFATGNDSAERSGFIVTDTGDLWISNGDMQNTGSIPWLYRGNIFSGATATEKTSWGGIKSQFR